MLTFEKVLAGFEEYLKKDMDCEIVKTKRGYLVCMWDNSNRNYEFIEYCDTPDDLKKELLPQFSGYLMYKHNLGVNDDLTFDEQAFIDNEVNKIELKLNN